MSSKHEQRKPTRGINEQMCDRDGRVPKWLWGFSVSFSQKDTVVAYILNQKEHHHKLTFKEEFVAFLEKYGVKYDEQYLWD